MGHCCYCCSCCTSWLLIKKCLGFCDVYNIICNIIREWQITISFFFPVFWAYKYDVVGRFFINTTLAITRANKTSFLHEQPKTPNTILQALRFSQSVQKALEPTFGMISWSLDGLWTGLALRNPSRKPIKPPSSSVFFNFLFLKVFKNIVYQLY